MKCVYSQKRYNIEKNIFSVCFRTEILSRNTVFLSPDLQQS